MRPHWIILAILTGGLTAGSDVRACNVPVFRYALERWHPDAYEAVIFHKGPATDELKALAKQIGAAAENVKAPANVEPVLVDVDKEGDTVLRKLWLRQKDAPLPWLVLRYPGSGAKEPFAWAGKPTADVLKALTHSPARQEISQRLMKGHSVVWVVVESGDKAQDDAAAARLEETLKKLEKTIKLPTDADIKKEPTADDKLLSELPLKVSFSVLRVSRTDPAEKLLVAMLVNSDEEVAERSKEPIMFPIFGRGRALDAFVGKGINADTVSDAASFLCAACSCTVKRLNPGFDLVMAVDWDAVLGGRERPPVPTDKPGKPVPIPPGIKPTPKPAPR